MNTVGIDFGTTKTLAAYIDDQSGHVELIHLGRSGPEMPTTIHVDKARQLLFGEDADDQLAIDPAGYQRRIKSGLGTSRRYLLNGHEFSAEDLAAEFLGHLRRRIEKEHFHGKLGRAVITIPAKFGPAARQDLEKAVERAGFKNFEILEEPIAAGIAFLEEKKGTDLGNEILVFDWGGGTLDIALVERREEQWILHHDHLEGDANLGGEDIDEAVFDAVNVVLSGSGQALLSPADKDDYPQIYRRCVETKKILSKKESHSFSHSSEKFRLKFNCSREQLEGRIADLVDRAMACVEKWREKAGAKTDLARKVLLVGGSSQIPIVSKRLEQKGMQPIPWTRGMHAVAMGAALRAEKGPSLREQAIRGDENAMMILAMSYMNGKGVDQNPTRAFEWFCKAAISGNTNGMNWAGHCLKNGIGTVRNLSLAVNQFRRSALMGNADGMLHLGACLMEGAEGDVGKVEGLSWIQKSAEKRCPDGMFQFGMALLSSGERGNGVRWLKGAAELGNHSAQAFLESHGEKYILDEAFFRFYEAAKAGDAEGMYNVSKCYRFGSGTDRNVDLAERWLENAAVAGHEAAKRDLQKHSGRSATFPTPVIWILCLLSTCTSFFILVNIIPGVIAFPASLLLSAYLAHLLDRIP
jgi:TPR repeat protein